MFADRGVFREKSNPVPIAGGSRKHRRTDGTSGEFDGIEMPGFPQPSMVHATKDGSAINYKTRPEVGHTPRGIDRVPDGVLVALEHRAEVVLPHEVGGRQA